jgi:cell division transport system permease protein
MMVSALLRIIKMALKNFWRNIWLSIASIAVLVLTLVTVTILAVLSLVGTTAISSVEQKIDISVYLHPGASEEQIRTVERDIQTFDGVVSVTYISQEEALNRFRDRHQDSDLILESLTELDDNPLQPSFIVLAENTQYYPAIAERLSSEAYKEIVEDITYKDNKEIIDKLSRGISVVQKVGLAVSGTFILISILVAFNTVRLTIYNRRTEIEIMRLVGASNWFIRWPFIVEGLMYGIIATLLNIVVFYPAFLFFRPSLERIFPAQSTELIVFAQSYVLYIILIQLFIAIFIGVLSSSIAIRRYLRI